MDRSLLALENSVEKMLTLRFYILLVSRIVLVSFIASTKVYADSSDTFSYREPLHPTKVIVIDVQERMIIYGDVGNAITICGDREKYYCFYNQDIAFAVPVNNFENKKSWKYNGVDYRNIGERTLFFMNTSVEAHVIVAEIGDIIFHYVYSGNLGLVAIELFYSKSKEKYLYLLSGKYGFAHNIKTEK